MAPKRELQIFIQANITVGKKLKPCQEWPHLLSFSFIKVFCKMTTCPRQPLLSGPISGRLISAVSRAILKLAYQFGIPNSNPQTLKSVDFWCKLSSAFLVAEPREWCFELFRMQNSQKHSRVLPLDPTGEGLQHCLRLPSCTMVFLLTMLVEKPTLPKNCWIWHCLYRFGCTDILLCLHSHNVSVWS